MAEQAGHGLTETEGTGEVRLLEPGAASGYVHRDHVVRAAVSLQVGRKVYSNRNKSDDVGCLCVGSDCADARQQRSVDVDLNAGVRAFDIEDELLGRVLRIDLEVEPIPVLIAS